MSLEGRDKMKEKNNAQYDTVLIGLQESITSPTSCRKIEKNGKCRYFKEYTGRTDNNSLTGPNKVRVATLILNI